MADIHGISSAGAGVGRLPDGRAVFVHRTAPGDRVSLRVLETRKRWARGGLVRVLDAGPGRREAPCPHYARCGGCVLEHLRYEDQLEAKARRVVETLERVGGLEAVPEPEVHPSPTEFRYRNRATFTLRRGPGRGEVAAGFHELEAPDRLVDLGGECLLLEPAVARGWDGIRHAWGPGAGRLPGGPELRLTVQGLADGSCVLLVEGGRGAGRAAELLDRVPGLRAVWTAERTGEEPRLAGGSPEVEDDWMGERIPLRPGTFLQVNRQAATLLHDLALEALRPVRGLRLVDAYCGIGTYARRGAAEGATSVGIELSGAAIEAARGLPAGGATFVEGKVENRIGEALPADRVVLNPPRQGIAAGVARALLESEPRVARIVYVSCDPATLARDLRRLSGVYALRGLAVVDLFPQTAHVETVATLELDDR